jgi:Leucine-rich repeat (LRR) protein
MSKLQLLSVGNNQIIGSLPELNLPQLQYLAITDNPCTDISNLSSSNISSLILLKLSNTHIKKLTRMNFPKLEIIKADKCLINDISEFSLSDLPSLNKLNL